MAYYSTIVLHLKAVENKRKLMPETDVSKSTEYSKQIHLQVKKRTNKMMLMNRGKPELSGGLSAFHSPTRTS